MYDEKKCDTEGRVDKLIPLAKSLLERGLNLELEDRNRNLKSWMPVVVEILKQLLGPTTLDFRGVQLTKMLK